VAVARTREYSSITLPASHNTARLIPRDAVRDNRLALAPRQEASYLARRRSSTDQSPPIGRWSFTKGRLCLPYAKNHDRDDKFLQLAQDLLLELQGKNSGIEDLRVLADQVSGAKAARLFSECGLTRPACPSSKSSTSDSSRHSEGKFKVRGTVRRDIWTVQRSGRGSARSGRAAGSQRLRLICGAHLSTSDLSSDGNRFRSSRRSRESVPAHQ